jgi:membrane dipeptidase
MVRITTSVLLTALILLAGAGISLAQMKTDSPELAQVREILREVPLIDGHNDLPWQYRLAKKDVTEIDLRADTSKLEHPLITDIPRLRAGGLGAQFWSAYVPPSTNPAAPVQAAFEQVDLIRRLCSHYPDTFELALTTGDIQRIHRQGRIASLIGLEGGHCINNSVPVLRSFYALGARYLTLTHVKNTDWADAAGDKPRHNGLAAFGKEVVREMNRLGMLIDLSHVTDEVMRDALAISKAPVICSHSSARVVCNSQRNVPDELLKRIAENGGIVMACFLPGYLNDSCQSHFALAMQEKGRLEQLYQEDTEKIAQGMAEWRKVHPAPVATLADVANHIDHIRKVAGIDHVGIGSDYEGFHGCVKGLEDVSCYPALLAELLRRGYSTEDIQKVAGLNFLRVFRQVEEVAAQLRKSPPGGT